MKKKLLSILLMSSMLCQMLIFLPVASAETLTEGYLLIEDFEDGTSSFKNTDANLECGIITENGESYYKVKNNGTGPTLGNSWNPEHTAVTFSEDENTRVVTFDIMLPAKDYYGSIYVRTGGWAIVYSITADGYIIADWNTQTAKTDALAGFEYTPGEWYTLTAVYDKEAGEVEAYKDYQPYALLGGATAIGDNVRLAFKSATGTAGVSNTLYIDNLMIGTEEIFEAENTSHLTLECEELGQAFWGKTLGFGVRVHNDADVNKTFDVTVTLTNDLGTQEFTKTEEVELAAGETKTIDYSVGLSRYAVYDLDVTSVDKSTNYEQTLTTELVTLKKSGVQNPRLGIIDHSADLGDGYGRFYEKHDYIAKMGMSAIRSAVTWSDYEKQKGVYTLPEKHKKVFDSIKEHNLELLLIDGYNNPTVTTAAGLADEKPPKSADNINLFGKYVYNMTNDTEPYAYGYEVYNEWNVTPDFNRDNLSAADYIPLIKETYEQTKAANPAAKVYGLSGMTWNRKSLYKEMLIQMFANGVHNYCDGFSMHTYAHQGSPDDGIAVECIDYTRQWMNMYGAGDKELIITEMGWQAETHDIENIASWVVKYSAMVYDKVDKMYWYCSQRKKRDVGEAEKSYGWMQDEIKFNDYVPYQPLPQFRAMANYNSFIGDAKSKKEIKLTKNTTVYSFRKADNTDVYMAWVNDDYNTTNHILNRKTESVTFELDADYALVSDIYGNETRYELNDGQLTLTLTNEPQYIYGGFESGIFEGEDISVSVLNTAGKVCVSGSIGLANERLSILVKKGGVIKHIDQTKSDINGNFALTFPINKEYGVYTLSVGTIDRETPRSLYFDIEAFDIEILNGDTSVDEMTDLNAGDTITINAAKKIAVSNPSVIAAQYNENGGLVKVDILECAEGQQITIEENVSNIRVYVWSIVDISPLSREITIK